MQREDKASDTRPLILPAEPMPEAVRFSGHVPGMFRGCKAPCKPSPAYRKRRVGRQFGVACRALMATGLSRNAAAVQAMGVALRSRAVAKRIRGR